MKSNSGMSARDTQSYLKRVLRLVPGLADAYGNAWAIVSSLRTQQSLSQALAPFWPRSAGSPDVLARIALEAAIRTPVLLVTLIGLVKGRALTPITLTDFCISPTENDAERLSCLFNQYGSDKASHDYHVLYSEIFTRAGSIERLLEIGMGTNNVNVPSHMGSSGKPGASLRAFRDALPDATIFGADIDSGIMFNEERIFTFVVDQTQPAALAALGEKIVGDLDILIDDGLHAPHANLAVLAFALQKLRRGGWLVIEDIQ